jgi:Ca2+-binding EF-hand superfamily protein
MLKVGILQEEYDNAVKFLCVEMGLDLKSESHNVPINFTKDEINLYIKRFRALDTDNKGYVSVTDLRRYFKVQRLITFSLPDSAFERLLNGLSAQVFIVDFVVILTSRVGSTTNSC